MLRSILILLFISVFAAAQVNSPMTEARWTPDEIQADANDKKQIGSSGLPGVHTRVIHGDPSKPGYYSILLFVPPNTTIQAHSHRDHRIATVVSGEWNFGYGSHFDSNALKTLPPGSVYTEPGGRDHNHFAQTTETAVVVQISGFGPTDTVYFDPKNEPQAKKK